jgi:polyribonucleotide nucleotidyltransferase
VERETGGLRMIVEEKTQNDFIKKINKILLMKYNLEIDGKTYDIEFNNLAEQANGSVFVRIGDTVVMATATMSSKDIENLDFFPLTVDFEEKFYAAGKILGSRFVRREGRPTENATVTARLIDRAIRPLFPAGLKRQVQVIVTCLSFDEVNDPDIAGLLAVSLALGISDIPWNGPVAPIRIGKTEKGLIFNPDYQQREKQEFEVTLVGVEENGEPIVNMIEAQAKETQEEALLEAVKEGSRHFKKILETQKEIFKKTGKPKIEIQKEIEPEIEQKLKQNFEKKLEQAMFQPSLIDNKRLFQNVQQELIDFTKENFGEEKIGYAKAVLENLLDEILHKNILEEGRRPDGRKMDEIRPISSKIDVLPRVHGSALFVRGATKALSAVTLGAPGDQRLIEGMEIREKKRYMHHYNFPPFCSGETKPLRGPGRREIGHGMLAEKALFPLIPNSEEFPYTIRVVTEILSSNGSTSMASVSSSSLSLMAAGVPIKNPAAGIAIGLIKSKDKHELLIDIQGPEDHYGDMDFKVAGTLKGITVIQMDVKIKGIDYKIIEQALFAGKTAREKILQETAKTIAEPKKVLSPFAPQILIIKINPDKIGAVIGSGGSVINEIIEKCQANIDIEDNGTVFISANSKEAAQKAADWVTLLAKEAKKGDFFEGKVKKIFDFGAMVSILPGQSGLVHISELADRRVEKVQDVVKIGDTIPVKVISIDDQGRINLSLKQALPK